MWAVFLFPKSQVMLSEDAVAKFQKLYRKHFGREISPEEAREKGAQLLRFMELMRAPLKEEEFQELQERVARNIQ
ncbi:MAG: hypothetical protein WDN67_01960 [Candidatus Moraniibacteriota bacterium]